MSRRRLLYNPGDDENRGIDAFSENIQPGRCVLELPVVDFLDGIKQRHPAHEFGAFVDHDPDAFFFGINLAPAVFTRAAAGSVAQPLGTPLAADEGGRGQEAFAAVMTPEQGHFDKVFQKEKKPREFPLFGRYLLPLKRYKIGWHGVSFPLIRSDSSRDRPRSAGFIRRFIENGIL
jgi:hypothetical protein